MAIQPLQLPALINVPQVNFSALGDIGNTLHDYAMRQRAQDLISGALGEPQLSSPAAQQAPAPTPGTGGTSLGDMATTDYAARTRRVESNNNPAAQNPNSSASGTYQFTDPTWIDAFNKTFPQAASMPDAQKLAYKNDPRYADVQNSVFKTFTQGNAQALSAQGLPVNNETLYAAHFFGAGDAPKVLTADPNTPLAAIIQPASLAANPQLAHMTAGQARQWLSSQMGGAPQPQTVPAPSGGVPVAQPQQPATSGLPPALAQRIGQMLTNPYTAKLGQALLAKYVTPPTYAFQTLPNGTVIRTDSLHGTVAPVYQAQTPYGFTTLADGTIVRTNAAQGTVQPIFKGPAKPIPVTLGGTLAVPNGQGGYKQAFANQTGLFDQNTLTNLADQYLAGYRSVLQNLGRSNMGALNIAALRERIVSRAKERGISPTDIAARIGQFDSYISAQKATGTRAGNVTMASIEAGNLGNLVVETSNAVPRGNLPLWNKVTNSYYENTGDPNIVKFTGALNSFINAYARAINPSGTSTVSDKDHAREILNTAMSHGQIDAGVAQLLAELEQVKKSPGSASKTLSDQFTQRANPANEQAPQSIRSGRLQLPKGVSGAMVVSDAKKAWPTATPEQRAAMQQKALAYGIDLSKYGLQ